MYVIDVLGKKLAFLYLKNGLMIDRIKLFIISLWFLFLILFIIKADIPISFAKESKFIGFKRLIATNGIPLFALTFMILGAFFYFDFNNNLSKGAPLLPRRILTIKNINSKTLAFLATYVVPLACIDMDKSRALPLLVLLISLIGWIYISTNLFYTNPTLAIIGFKTYQIDTESEKDIIIITKHTLKANDSILPRHISENIYFVKKSRI
ncbi:hypothetical protein L3C95_33170 [Chitinophaga filiformis]|uniref:anti-phage protein KwaA n=1 Tax=Chitinophaga filiformis TaxID=104663 RepID=UPI001F3CCCD0|nr:anti-phage protein KwaA [Chitinophaga filiformis]MCF6407786.1 hypothetical protein [Chitinophaga filiformis]